MFQQIDICDVVTSLSEAVDLVDSRVNHHHKRVAYIAYKISEELGLSARELQKIVTAGQLHDIGALTLQERLAIHQFEADHLNNHAELGYLFLKQFEAFHDVAHIVRYHHQYFFNAPSNVAMGSHILHLADRVEILIQNNQFILSQVDEIKKKITSFRGIMFEPDAVDAFLRIAEKEYFWLDAVNPSLTKILHQQVMPDYILLNIDGLLDIARLFSQIIDFRSHFTATHSTGVAYSAEKLAQLAGFSDSQAKLMRIAGFLHDLGKLAVPLRILEKPGKLTAHEYNIMKSHTYYTRRVLENIKGFDQIVDWAANHHERLHGKGYPFHLNGDQLSEGARIMAIADVFTAIMEDRPYRKGVSKQKALQIIDKMVDEKGLDGDIVELLRQHFEEINFVRLHAQQEAIKDYELIMKQPV